MNRSVRPQFDTESRVIQMGEMYEAACRDCFHTFQSSDGGGFHFFDLHCTECGQVQSVAHDLIPEATEQYHRAAGEALAVDYSNAKPLIALPVDGEELSRLREAIAEATARFNEAIEPIIGRCSCGGRFALGAPVRCPFCKSTNTQRRVTLMDYD